MSTQRHLPAYFGHHKTATKWTEKILRAVCVDLDLNYVKYNMPPEFNYDLKRAVQENHVEYLACINANYEYVSALTNYRGFHVVRDPRDIAVSAYFSHRYSHATDDWNDLNKHRSRLEKMTQEDGLLADMEFTARLSAGDIQIRPFDAMRTWNYEDPDIMEIKFEDLTAHPYSVFLDVFSFQGLLDESPVRLRYVSAYCFMKSMYLTLRRFGFAGKKVCPQIPSWKVLSIINDFEFKKMTAGRNPGQADPTHHYRKGISGDWKNHFTEVHRAYFKEHYNDLLIKLGYEQDDQW